MASEGYVALPLPDRVQVPPEVAVAQAEAFRLSMARRHSVRAFAPDPVPEAVIRAAVATAAGAPSGANRQPWHFACIGDPGLKRAIREGVEEEERAFYGGGAGDPWLAALEPLGTGVEKPHLTTAPWLIVVFAERWGEGPGGERWKNYYVPESVGIACGFLIAAIHQAGLVTLPHTPNPMRFLNDLLGRPEREKPVMICPVGYPAADATVPAAAKRKKPFEAICSLHPAPGPE
ncbi:nitroreductase family protein [Litorisediminicola beolgyonensis]|uniref:Nitroreductase family protein n=1 Tax=Litorisediminicola beolgyonensis TaxID=1173614 RepID=A0ABW3ZMX9_9RHOB